MATWENFFIAQVGASAALAGLVFVGVSINLAKILSYPGLPGRALEALAVLIEVLVASSLMLVPGQSQTVVGIELLAVGIAVWGLLVTTQISYTRIASAAYRKYRRSFVFRVVLAQIASLPLIIAGVVILLGNWNGMYWLVPAFIFSILMAMTNSWILIIEINR